jgi:MFS family permease
MPVSLSFLRLFFPLALGYYLSYFYRTVNAVIAPDIISELSLSPADMGWVSSAYFASFALFQIPLGVLLDRVEIRKIGAVLLLFAALGAVIFSQADSVTVLWVGRFFIGLGVSACLMGAFKAYVIWMPTERLPLLNGLQLAAGGIGALTATAPVEMALQITDWRSVFLVLAGCTLFCSALIFTLIPKQQINVSNETIGSQLNGYLYILKHPVFYSVAPISFLAQGAFISLQSLWIGQWLRDVTLLPRDVAADYLFIAALATVLGYAGMGVIASKLLRFGINSKTVCIGGMNIFMLIQLLIVLQVDLPLGILWFVFGFIGTSGSLMYTFLLQQFEQHLSGRVITSLNLLLFVLIFLLQWLMGVIVNQWPLTAAGTPPAIAYQYAFGLGLALQIAGALWYVSQRIKIKAYIK